MIIYVKQNLNEYVSLYNTFFNLCVYISTFLAHRDILLHHNRREKR